MIIAEVITSWIGDGSIDDPRRPAIYDDYKIKRCTDVTGQLSDNLPPNPNIYVTRIIVEQAVLDQIEVDPKYKVINIEGVKPKEEVPLKSELDDLKSYLLTYNYPFINSLDNKRRDQISFLLKDWFKTRPKIQIFNIRKP